MACILNYADSDQIPPWDKWKDYEDLGLHRARKCARASVSNLTATKGLTAKLSAPGNDGYITAARSVMGTGTYTWTDGKDAALKIKALSGQGNHPIQLLYLAGHHYVDTKALVSYYLTAPFEASNLLDPTVADVPDNNTNEFKHAKLGHGPPKCWFTVNAMAYGIGCNTASVWMDDWASTVMRKGTTVYGSNKLVYPGYEEGKYYIYTDPATKVYKLPEIGGIDWSTKGGTW